ncbi:glycosyltransferase [Hansschlegelia quercus]|uniref:glycosyltransferase n=1 Tax=Hansschlegelia quercus TaxID=2528245 RepID=UPI002479161D|nr:glycosyltransferase [Hansschlegelia quercus]
MFEVPLVSVPRAVVAVPARDEELRLPILLDALAGQAGLGSSGVNVVVVLNNCQDRSAEVAEQAARRNPRLALTVRNIKLPPERAHVGEARRIAMDEAAIIAGHGGVILTTDADATPPPNWISQTLAAFAAGADLVGGRLVGDPDEEAALGPDFLRRARSVCRYQDLCDELAALLDPLPFDPWPRHHDHTGASLAVRADVYRALGGLEPLPFREDLAFVAKARAGGYRLRHPPDLHVSISARLDGRARNGMADCLKAWCAAEAQGLPTFVEDPAAIEQRLRRRAALRALDGAPLALVSATLDRLGLSSDLDGDAHPAALIERHAADDPEAPQTVLVSDAIATLIDRIAYLRGEFDAA